jgi:hypothetical protein
MRLHGPAFLLATALASAGCFQMTTIVHVNADGSGTIDHRMDISKAALAQVRQFAALGGSRGQNLDFTSEAQARETAAKLGPGVTYVSSEPINTEKAEGRATSYAFTDVSQIRISESPDAPAGLPVHTQSSGSITCSITHEANGNSVLHINLPEPNFAGAIGTATDGQSQVSQQLAMIRMLLAGARVLIAVEPAGHLVRTSSPFVDGQRVTIIDVSLDDLLGNQALITRLQAAKTPEETRAALKDVPNAKLVLDHEITIEFK